jgi:ABC-2 type transport system ATP-binding protein
LVQVLKPELAARSSGHTVRVRTPEPDLLARALEDAGARVARGAAPGADGPVGLPSPADLPSPGGLPSPAGTAGLTVSGLAEEQIGDIAFANGVRVHHLSASRASLEQAFMELTADTVDNHARQALT